jgi:hypothetical protein
MPPQYGSETNGRDVGLFIVSKAKPVWLKKAVCGVCYKLYIVISYIVVL